MTTPKTFLYFKQSGMTTYFKRNSVPISFIFVTHEEGKTIKLSNGTANDCTLILEVFVTSV